MPRRASLPEGKSLFFRPPAAPGEAEAIESESAPLAAPGALPEHGATRQSAIFLEERQIDWLEDKCREARRRGGRAIRKAVIIRALIDVAMESPVDLTALRHEDDLIERIRKGLRGG
ncbi:MAG TPA: hypothetical protein VNL16_12205 [Chloroflexota bacterium]|nr:hypothetical protein [Chloroflexota bacterium]